MRKQRKKKDTRKGGKRKEKKGKKNTDQQKIYKNKIYEKKTHTQIQQQHKNTNYTRVAIWKKNNNNNIKKTDKEAVDSRSVYVGNVKKKEDIYIYI